MERAEAQEFTDGLGQIFAGSWRMILHAQRQGVPEALDMTTEEWVRALGGYVRLTVEERREAVAELTAEGMTQREIASVLGASPATVNRDLDAVSNETETGEEAARADDAEAEPVSNETPPPLAAVGEPEPEPQPEPRREPDPNPYDDLMAAALRVGTAHVHLGRETLGAIPQDRLQDLIDAYELASSQAIELHAALGREQAARRSLRVAEGG